MSSPEQWIKSPILENRYARDRLGVSLFSSPKVPLAPSEPVFGPASFVSSPESMIESNFRSNNGAIPRAFHSSVNFPHTPSQHPLARPLKPTPPAAPSAHILAPPPLSNPSKTADVTLSFRPPQQRDSVHPLLVSETSAFIVPFAAADTAAPGDGKSATDTHHDDRATAADHAGVTDVASASLRGVSAAADAAPLTLLAAQAVSRATFGTLPDSAGNTGGAATANVGANSLAPLTMACNIRDLAISGVTAPTSAVDRDGSLGVSAVAGSSGGAVSHLRYMHSSALPDAALVGAPFAPPQRAFGAAVDKKGAAAVIAAAAAAAPPPVLLRPRGGALGKFGPYANANNELIPPPSWMRAGDVCDDGTAASAAAAEAAGVTLGTHPTPTDAGTPAPSLSMMQHLLLVKHDRVRGTIERWVGSNIGIVPTKPHPHPDAQRQPTDDSRAFMGGSGGDDDDAAATVATQRRDATTSAPLAATAPVGVNVPPDMSRRDAEADAALLRMVLGEAASESNMRGSGTSGAAVWEMVSRLVLRPVRPDAVDPSARGDAWGGWGVGTSNDGTAVGGRSVGGGLGFAELSVSQTTGAPGFGVAHRLQQTLLQGTAVGAVAASGASALPPIPTATAAPYFSSDFAAAAKVATGVTWQAGGGGVGGGVDARGAPSGRGGRREPATVVTGAVAGHMTGALLTQTVNTSGLEIESVRLDGAAHLPKASLMAMASACRNLRMLSLASCPQADDEVLAAVAANAPALAYLDVSDCARVTAVGVGGVMSTASHLLALRAHGLNPGPAPPYPAVASVDGADPPLDAASDPLAYHTRDAICRKLMVCDVSGSDAVTDRFLHLIATLCPRLAVLSVASCSRVTSAGVHLIGAHCSSLTSLDLSSNPQPSISPEAFASIARAPRNLAHLDLGGCAQVSDETVTTIVARQQSLTSLSLAGTGITDLSLAAVAACCRQLVRLNLSVCRALSVGALLDLLHDVPSLSTLLLSACASPEEVRMLQAARPECKLVAHAWEESSMYRDVAYKPLKVKAPKPAPKPKK